MEKNEYRLVIDINAGISSGAITDKKQENSVDDIAKSIAPLITAYSMAQPFINASKQIMETQVNTKYGSKELSERINIGMSVAQFATKTFAGVAGGASLASALGLSAGFGGIAGATIAIGSKITNMLVNYNEISNKRAIENEQIGILAGRAGIQFNRSRSGE